MHSTTTTTMNGQVDGRRIAQDPKRTLKFIFNRSSVLFRSLPVPYCLCIHRICAFSEYNANSYQCHEFTAVRCQQPNIMIDWVENALISSSIVTFGRVFHMVHLHNPFTTYALGNISRMINAFSLALARPLPWTNLLLTAVQSSIVWMTNCRNLYQLLRLAYRVNVNETNFFVDVLRFDIDSCSWHVICVRTTPTLANLLVGIWTENADAHSIALERIERNFRMCETFVYPAEGCHNTLIRSLLQLFHLRMTLNMRYFDILNRHNHIHVRTCMECHSPIASSETNVSVHWDSKEFTRMWCSNFKNSSSSLYSIQNMYVSLSSRFSCEISPQNVILRHRELPLVRNTIVPSVWAHVESPCLQTKCASLFAFVSF